MDELARTIASKSPLGLSRGRNAFFAIEGRPLEDQVAHLLTELVALTTTEDAKEGITAFLENRPPTSRAADSLTQDSLCPEARRLGE